MTDRFISLMIDTLHDITKFLGLPGIMKRMIRVHTSPEEMSEIIRLRQDGEKDIPGFGLN